jgi:hypothetical protein
MAFTKQHAQQLRELRQWARKKGRTPTAPAMESRPRLSSAERRAQNAALKSRLSAVLGPSENDKRDGTAKP